MNIEGIALVEASLGRWCPSDLAFIDRICVTSETDTFLCIVKIVGRFQRRNVGLEWPDLDKPFYRFELEFQGVTGLRLRYDSPGGIAGFMIDDISRRQLEGVNYEVGDYEGGAISFFCAGVRVVG